MVVRDKRLKKYNSSLLAVIQTNVYKGPILFYCYPNFAVDLTCPMRVEALKLDVHIQHDEFHEFKNFVVIFRVCFRSMFRNLNTYYLSPLLSNSHKAILL